MPFHVCMLSCSLLRSPGYPCMFLPPPVQAGEDGPLILDRLLPGPSGRRMSSAASYWGDARRACMDEVCKGAGASWGWLEVCAFCISRGRSHRCSPAVLLRLVAGHQLSGNSDNILDNTHLDTMMLFASHGTLLGQSAARVSHGVHQSRLAIRTCTTWKERTTYSCSSMKPWSQ